jgi:hypothetical protein
VFSYSCNTLLHFTQWDVASVTHFCNHTWNNGLHSTSYVRFPTLGSHELLNDGHRNCVITFLLLATCFHSLPVSLWFFLLLVLLIRLRETVINSIMNTSLLRNACKYLTRLEAPHKYHNRLLNLGLFSRHGMGKTRYIQNFSRKNMREIYHLQVEDVEMRIILKWILKKQTVNVWQGFTMLRTGGSGGFCEHG